ncbi:MAG: cytochrome c peroxidase [Candidatus Aminicenantaceae bacterium]
MRHYKLLASLAVVLALAFCAGQVEEPAEDMAASALTPKEELGRKLFFDARLSEPAGQACAFCHGPEVGFTGPDPAVNAAHGVYPGALAPRFGNAKPPSAAYAGASPKLHIDEEGTFVGGLFWNGRAAGWDLGDPLAEQAMGPFLNPLEQNLPDKAGVVKMVLESEYADLFREVWGPDSLSLEDVEGVYESIARSIAAFERTAEVNPFSSRFDDFWRRTQEAGLDVEDVDEDDWEQFKGMGLEDDEVEGLMLFATQGKCAECHVLTPVDGNPPLFTDFTYDNLGAPRNPDNPFYIQDAEFNPDGDRWVDKGLGGFLEGIPEYQQYAAENIGKYKVPTLRNVDKRPSPDFAKAFLHNGFLKTLKEVVHFYNTRDLEEEGWPAPEIEANVNTEELGDLGLTEEEEDLIVLFMKTLTDR